MNLQENILRIKQVMLLENDIQNLKKTIDIFLNTSPIKPKPVEHVYSEIEKIGDNEYKILILYYFPKGTNLRQYTQDAYDWNWQIISHLRSYFNIDIKSKSYGLRRYQS
jgi:hypothetical protein